MIIKTLFFTIVFSITLFLESQAQFTEFTFSPEILFSDITSNQIDGGIDMQDLNTWKYRGGFRLGTNYAIWRDKLHLKTSLFYNERKALEFFAFSAGDSTFQNGITYKNIFASVPTSPQSEGFGEKVVPAIHFPNFKYLHLELLPVWRGGNKWQYEFGAGFSAGILLNRKQVTIDESYFPWDNLFFPPNGTANGEVLYHRYDLAWTAYAGIRYILSPQFSVGITARRKQSIIAMNDSFRGSYTDDVKWIIYTGGIQIIYNLKAK